MVPKQVDEVPVVKKIDLEGSLDSHVKLIKLKLKNKSSNHK